MFLGLLSMSGVRHILPSSIQHAGDSLPGPADGQHIIATKNRWSRITLKFENITPDVWCEFGFEITCHPEEAARLVDDFAAVGVAFLMEDGSTIDFSYIPGLVRAQIDPFNAFVTGPDHDSRAAHSAKTSRVHCHFLIPAPTRDLLVTVRGWRNSHPFQVIKPTLRQFVQPIGTAASAHEPHLVPTEGEREAASRVTRTWKALTTKPLWYRYALLAGHPLFIRGQIVTRETGKDGALARVVFRDAQGKQLPLPYPETLMTPAVGAFINIPAHIQARRFTLELTPPPQAATVEIGFQAWHDHAAVELVTPLEVSLEVSFLLENVSGDDFPNAAHFLERLVARLDPFLASDQLGRLLDQDSLAERMTVHTRLRAVQQGNKGSSPDGRLRLGDFAPWTLPQKPSWSEDPYGSPAWRHEFQSLAWLLDLAGGPDAGALDRAVEHALSWSRANPWGQPTDDLSVHPVCMAVRTEVLLELLALGASRQRMDPAALLELVGETARHCFALAEILGQNIFSHSLDQLHAASSLLAAATALPRIPLSSHWASLALACLRQGFDELLGPDGVPFERSPHYQLELLSLGLILVEALPETPETPALREFLTTRLRNALLTLITITDPGGMLPAFGDTPHGYHHASWIRRLISHYGRKWLTDRNINAEMSYPQGSRVLPLSRHGIIAARNYERGRDWGYFCASLSEQRHAHGHYDATSFIFSSAGVRWIVDPGGVSAHEASSAREFLISSRAHNVAVPDARPQAAGTSWVRSQISFDGINVFEICSNVYGPDYVHRRVYVTADDLSGLAVFDDFTGAEEKLSFDGFLHFGPGIAVALAQSQLVIAFQNRKRLQIVPKIILGEMGGLEIVQGARNERSLIQGYVSHHGGGPEPANVLRYTLFGERRVCGGILLAVSGSGLSAMNRALEDRRVTEILRTQSEDQVTGEGQNTSIALKRNG
jgi:hypothetical protein